MKTIVINFEQEGITKEDFFARFQNKDEMTAFFQKNGIVGWPQIWVSNDGKKGFISTQSLTPH